MATLQRLALRGTPKATKAAARYTPAGGAERCGMCRHYVPSSSCARIEGPVSAAGWCMLYSQQVTWRPRAGQDAGGGVPAGLTLDMSFLTPGALPAGLTFTRASTGTYFDATGAMQSAAINAPRWDYDPSTLALRGLLIEEARTNSTVNFSNYTASNTTVTAASGVAPDGTTTAYRIAETATTSFHGAARIVAVTASTMYTYSVFAKAQQNQYIQLIFDDGSTNGCQATFDLVGGTITGPLTAHGTAVIGTAAMQATGNGYYRCSIACSIVTTSSRVGVYFSTTPNPVFAPSYAGNAANGALLWGPQLEAGTYASSYIPTTVAAVTRSADVCTAPTGAWFNAAASSLAADFMVAQAPNPSAVNARSPAALNDGSANNRLVLYGERTSSSTAVILTGITGTNTGGPVLGSISANAVSKIAGAWNGTAAVGALNGATAVSYAIGMPAGLSTMVIGTDGIGAGTSYLNGWARRVRYWNRALSAAELQSVTT